MQAPVNMTQAQNKVNPAFQPKVNPPVQPKNVPQNQVQSKPVNQPKPAPPVQPKVNPNQNVAAAQPKVAAPAPAVKNNEAAKESGSKPFSAGLWVLPILLFLPGGIIASMMAKKQGGKGTELLIGGIITTVLYGMIAYMLIMYKLK
jgi:hypothetical protein